MKRLPLFFPLAKKAVSYLVKGRLTVSIAESCTGGRLSDTLTNIPGSSACFMGTVVAYSNEAKIKLLSVPKKTIEKCGAVSEETAALMAENVRKMIKSDIGLSVTGIAGPGGGTIKKPVGLVYFGLTYKNNKAHVKKRLFKGSREKIKEQAVRYALEWLISFAMMNPEDYEGLLETIEILSDKETAGRIKKAKEELKKGKTISIENLRQRIKKLDV